MNDHFGDNNFDVLYSEIHNALNSRNKKNHQRKSITFPELS